MKKSKRYLRNANGTNYEILAQRKSKKYVNSFTGKSVNDYLVKTPSGTVIIANGWDSRNKTWKHGNYFGKNVTIAKKNFKEK